MKVHHLKTLPEHFGPVCRGEKTAEVRLDDRGFAVGDLLVLHEWDGEKHTGASSAQFITHVLKGFHGLAEGWVMLSMTDAPVGAQWLVRDDKMTHPRNTEL